MLMRFKKINSLLYKKRAICSDCPLVVNDDCLRGYQRIGVVRQTEVACLRFVGVGDVPLELVAEMTDGGGYRPRGGIAQRANGIPLNTTLNIPQQINVLHGAFAVFDVL